MKKNHFIWLAPIIAILVATLTSGLGQSYEIAVTLGVTTWVGLWWITEAVPIPFASLIPFIMLPSFGVIDFKEASSAFGSHVIILLLGAFLLAKGLESSGVHKRIAFNIISFLGGTSAFRIVFAFMAASAILSMWISNTATVLALIPVATAVALSANNHKFAVVLLLGLAYSASIGGVGTLIGTPPNVIFASVYEATAGQEYGFLQWMKLGVPIVVITIPVVALVLTRGISLSHKIDLPEVGAWNKAEKSAIAVFIFIAFLWVFRKHPFGGWAELTGMAQVGDATIALFGALLMALIKTDNNQPVLTWDKAKTIPWDMLILFSSGICLAKGFAASGLSELIGQSLSGVFDLPLLLLLFALCLSLSFLTEVTSNTATATLFMPILASVAMEKGIPIELIMIPAVISCSFAFCLPVATAPNSIVFASGQLTIKDMAKHGVVLNFVGAAIVAVVVTLLY
ncbi:SLC13/DASS family transporter [Psychrosphaera ytuae]|uniref:SLC13/DASS family transporter n=1 Tax=Psychrosphaera ytuae TaxID=2820710 RepID=A0A975DCA2_9GAMM|nr:SLC13 family permease [Psychrosphaera ytuae]QTH64293.1 SLC13/DASS family transporter [Psychrosphaera ytuae]